ncbi:MAG TPA: hypothetical protein VK812_05455 [Candidatus Binatus sp.]|jgi:hypothetical protein|nr:hypothetical protein [Candidatus Binatus sp.]
MGSSFIEYRDYGFWSFDRFIECLAREVAEDIVKREKLEDWEVKLVAHWRLQASGGFMGCVHLKLDEFLTEEERRQQLRKVVQTVVDQHPPGDDPIRQTGVLLLQLLDGNLMTDASSPLDYMVDKKLYKAQQLKI